MNLLKHWDSVEETGLCFVNVDYYIFSLVGSVCVTN